MDIVCIGPITSYLACSVRPIFHIYSYSVNSWCITSFNICNLICFSVPSSFLLVCVLSEYKLNPNSIGIYTPHFLLQQKMVIIYRLIFYLRVVLLCFINVFVLYACFMMCFISLLCKHVRSLCVLYDSLC